MMTLIFKCQFCHYLDEFTKNNETHLQPKNMETPTTALPITAVRGMILPKGLLYVLLIIKPHLHLLTHRERITSVLEPRFAIFLTLKGVYYGSSVGNSGPSLRF